MTTHRPEAPGDDRPTPPAPPWTCRIRAVVCLAGASTGFAVVDYAATPVGPYREAFVGRLTGPLSGTVPWMVVDSAASMAGGREHWALPKEPARLQVDLPDGAASAGAAAEAIVEGGGTRVELRARVARVAVPVAVPGRLRQPGRGPAPVRFRGRGRPALVELSGDLPCGLAPGARPGVLLDGVLRIGRPRGVGGGHDR